MSNWLAAILSSSTIGLTGIFSFRIGRWVCDRRSAAHLADQASRHCDSTEVGVDANIDDGEADTIVLDLPPDNFRDRRIATHDAPTEFLPRIQDIVPPVRATPIRRPPWL